MARRTTLLLLLCAVGILLSASAASASRAEELWKKVRDEFAPQPEEAPAGMAPLPMDILRTLPDETVDESELKRLLDSVEGAVADVAEAGSKALAELVEAIRAKQGSFSHVAGEGIAVRPPKALVDPVPEPLVGPAIPAVPAAPVLPVTDNDDADEKEGHTCWFQEWFDFDSEDLDLEAVFGWCPGDGYRYWFG